MKTKNYCFAGVEISVAMPENLMYKDDRYLAPFAVDRVENPHIFTFELTDTITPPTGELVTAKPSFCVYDENGSETRYIGSVETGWQNAYMRVYHNGKNHTVQIKKDQYTSAGIGTSTVLSALAAEHLAVQTGGVVFHCSYIEKDGKAILFTAPSETGKSTQADLWHNLRDADIVNGDRAVIRVIDGRLYAAGVPFAGSSVYCNNRTVPLCVIVYLGQAPQTTIRKLRGYEAFAKVWEGISVNTWNKEDMEKASAIVKQVAEKIPVFYMPCTPDESAVIAVEKALEGERI